MTREKLGALVWTRVLQEQPPRWALLARTEVTGLGIRPANIVVVGGDSRDMEHVYAVPRCAVRRILRPLLSVLADHLSAFELAVYGRIPPDPSYSIYQLAKSLRRMARSRNGRIDSAPVAVLRPLFEPVTDPIDAGSDQVAIFELLASVGCSMPRFPDTVRT